MRTCSRARAARWIAIAFSTATPPGCGGIAEGENFSTHPHPDQNPTTDEPAASGGGPSEEPNPAMDAPSSRDVCGCPAEGEMFVLVFDPDGAEARFAQAPLPGLAPGERGCSPLNRPSAFRAGCGGSGSFALGACNSDGACVELGFKDELMVLNLWGKNQESVKAVVSRNWKFETNAQNGMVSGTFLLADQVGGAYQGAFSVCDLMESSMRFESEVSCTD